MPNDAAIAAVARPLAEALINFSYSRSDADKKQIAELHFRLCDAFRAEQAEIAAATNDAESKS